MKYYNLMYIDLDEKRTLSGRSYTAEKRIDLYIKNSCILDKSLKINGHLEGVIILTNNSSLIHASLSRIGYSDVEVKEIPFSLDVPKGIPFYSAHFKIDVFNYLGTLSGEYSILLDSDIVCMHSVNEEFLSIVEEGHPMVYNLPSYGGEKKIKDVQSILPSVRWLPWAGGEFIGGTSDFFKSLYDTIISFKDSYWDVVNDGLFHVGDEMMTSIALSILRKQKHVYCADAGMMGFIHRYWSVHERRKALSFDCPFLHLPGDKVFFSKVNLHSDSIREIMQGYELWHKWCLLKGFVHKTLKK